MTQTAKRTTPEGSGSRGEPGRRLQISDSETLRILAHPIRMQILQLMGTGDWTVRQIAEALGLGPTRLYRHVAALERHGLLSVTRTRTVYGIVEKTYRIAAAEIRVDSAMFGSEAQGDGAAALAILLKTTFQASAQEIQRSFRAGLITGASDRPASRRLRLSHDELSLAPAQADLFLERLGALLEEFSAEQPASEPGSERFAFLVGFYPIAGPGEGGGGASSEPAEVTRS